MCETEIQPQIVVEVICLSIWDFRNIVILKGTSVFS